MYEAPAPNAAIVKTDGNGNTLAVFQSTATIGGNTGFQLNQATAIGVLKTSATGVVSSSLTLPSGLSAPAFTVTGSFTATGLVTNAALANPATTVNGQTCTLGSTCTVTATASSALTFGTHLTSGGASYNGSAPITITSDATSANTVSTIMARDGSGQVAATTFTGALAGNAATVTTNANLTGDVTSVGNATTLTNAPVIAKVLTGYASGAGTVSAADSILSAFQKINGNDALKAPLASPALTGTPTAPTAAVDTNTTQIASTAMVLGQAASATPLIDGTAAVGTSTRYARGDHVHPTDTTRAPLVSPSFTTPSLGVATATSINGVTIDNTAWTAYTPTVTGGAGSCGACSVAATGRSKQIGKTMIAETSIAITAIGSWSGSLIATLPATSATALNAGVCFESSVTGKSGASFTGSGSPTFSTRDAAAGSWWVNGYVVTCTITYELP
jgi:hypothetical protein